MGGNQNIEGKLVITYERMDVSQLLGERARAKVYAYSSRLGGEMET